MRLTDPLFNNPLGQWFLWLYWLARAHLGSRGKGIRIGYMAFARRCSFGKNVTIYSFARLDSVTIGDMSYVSRDARIANVDIGKFACIGPETLLGLGRHPTRDFVSSHPAFYSTRRQAQITFVAKAGFGEFERIKIGNDVWVGARAIIMDGVSIGDGAVVAAGAIVTKDVAPYAIVAGSPARVLRYRFSPEQITQLLAIAWWDRPLQWLQEHAGEFADARLFIGRNSTAEADAVSPGATVVPEGSAKPVAP